MGKVKVILAGAGSIAESTHLLYLKKHPDVTVAAIVDINIKQAEEVASRNGVEQFYGSLQEAMEEVKADAVVICTPNQSHMALATMAAANGLDVFVEKPIGTDLESVEAYLQLAKEKRIITMAGMTHRFRRDAAILKEYADAETFGDIYYAKARLYRQRGTPKGWFTSKALAGGGALMDIGVHVLDLAWWLMGCPKVASITGKAVAGLGRYATKYTVSWESNNKQLNAGDMFDVEDFGAAWIRFEGGQVLSLEVAWAMNGEQDEGIDIEILGDKGGAKLSPLVVYTEENQMLSEKRPIFTENIPFEDEINHFVDCVKKREKPLADGEQAYEVLGMLLGIYESSRLNKEISFGKQEGE